MRTTKEEARARARELAARYADAGDNIGWFDAFYKEAEGNISRISWADLEPNAFFKRWAEENGLSGTGQKALVVGCGLGDDARYLADLGFDVTAFDISSTAIDWAKRLHSETNIRFVTADLLQPRREWSQAFDFVLEIYTIQPLPLEIRSEVVERIAEFVAPGGTLVVVTRMREDYEEPEQLPWPVSRRELSGFVKHGLVKTSFSEMPSDEEDEPPRFVIEYRHPRQAKI